MKYFPIFMDLDDRDVLLVGGGVQAAQKLRLLARTSARLTVIAEAPCAEVVALCKQHGALLQRRRFAAAAARNRTLIVAADGTPGVNAEVAAAARDHRVPINVVDRPDLSTVIVPAIVDRDPVMVAIGTEGASPVIARDLRARIEALLPAAFGRLARRAAALRPRVGRTIADVRVRRRFWEQLLRGRFARFALAGDTPAADREADDLLRIAEAGHTPTGTVSLIGCGPGDPDLLTLKALQRLQDADVLVYDRLVDPAILDYARRDAHRISVGKAPGSASTPQHEINRILVREALKGNRVARLKGGDAMIFGRAAEEIAAVRAAGIGVEVIPGITAAHAAAANLALPLTLRGKLREFSIVTGATADGELDLDWQRLAAPGHAFAVYMGVRSAPLLQRKLLEARASPDLSIVVVENATRAGERAISTALSGLAAAIAGARIDGPAIIFAGLDWQAARLSPPAHVTSFAAETGAAPARSGEIAVTAPAWSHA